jgi:hypothetical protein
MLADLNSKITMPHLTVRDYVKNHFWNFVMLMDLLDDSVLYQILKIRLPFISSESHRMVWDPGVQGMFLVSSV